MTLCRRYTLPFIERRHLCTSWVILNYDLYSWRDWNPFQIWAWSTNFDSLAHLHDPCEGPESQWPSRPLTSRPWAKSSQSIQKLLPYGQAVLLSTPLEWLEWTSLPRLLWFCWQCHPLVYQVGWGWMNTVSWMIRDSRLEQGSRHGYFFFQMIRSCCFKSKSRSSHNIEALFCGSLAGKLWSYAVSMCVCGCSYLSTSSSQYILLDSDRMLRYWIVCLYRWGLRRDWNVKWITTWILKGIQKNNRFHQISLMAPWLSHKLHTYSIIPSQKREGLDDSHRNEDNPQNPNFSPELRPGKVRSWKNTMPWPMPWLKNGVHLSHKQTGGELGCQFLVKCYIISSFDLRLGYSHFWDILKSQEHIQYS